MCLHLSQLCTVSTQASDRLLDQMLSETAWHISLPRLPTCSHCVPRAPPPPPSRVASCFRTLRPKPSGFALTPLSSSANPGDSPSKIHPDCGPVSRLLARLPSWFDFPGSRAGGGLRNKQPVWKMVPESGSQGAGEYIQGHSQGHCCRSRGFTLHEL